MIMGLALACALSGCSALIAIAQKTERTRHPTVPPGTPREKVEEELGWTWTTIKNPDGSKTTTYTYRRYPPSEVQEASKSPEARAKRYLLYDLIGVGIPEIAFTAIETAAKVNRWRDSESCTLNVTYGPDDRVIAADHSKVGCR